jgi:hypothetical protein
MKSLLFILGLLVVAIQVYNFKIQLSTTVIFEFTIELRICVVQHMQN